MLFNSYSFLLLFLPVTLGVFWLLGSLSMTRSAKCWLAVTSLFFYGWWSPRYLALILASILVNFALGVCLSRAFASGFRVRRGVLLAAGLAANLSALGYYKYADFFASNLNALLGIHLPLMEVFLPLGISFFTFQQMAYLVDASRGEVSEYNFVDYTLFVTFFPQLIAGPIVHHADVLPQFARKGSYRPSASNTSIGLTIFAFGLFKKVVIADGIARYGTPVFAAAEVGTSLTFFEAWGGALAYTFQLYFDFSGYSDMAIGLGRLFGIRIPLNFNSPYKAVSIIDFWKRWHMTLSQFLRDYLYIPLGGNRQGRLRRYVNLMITMLLGGLWHGANWTFVLWGGLHGAYLVINHMWRALMDRIGWVGGNSGVARWASLLLTFVCVVVGWVFFRASGVDSALAMLASMAGLNGIQVPAVVPTGLVAAANTVMPVAVTHGAALANGVVPPAAFAWLVLLFAITWGCPNAIEVFSRFRPVVGKSPWPPRSDGLLWYPRPAWAFVGVAAFAFAMLRLSEISEFLYFQF